MLSHIFGWINVFDFDWIYTREWPGMCHYLHVNIINNYILFACIIEVSLLTVFKWITVLESLISKLMNYENWTKSRLSNESVPKRQSSYLYEWQQINHLKIREWIKSGKLFSEAKWINLYEYFVVREWITNSEPFKM